MISQEVNGKSKKLKRSVHDPNKLCRFIFMNRLSNYSFGLNNISRLTILSFVNGNLSLRTIGVPILSNCLRVG